MKLSFRKAAASGALEPKIRIPEVWSDEHGIALRGWILTPDGPPDELRIQVDGQAVPVIGWHPRPRIVAKHPEFRSGENCGFWAYLPKNSTHQVAIHARTGREVFRKDVLLRPRPSMPAAAERGSLFARFCSIVNRERLSVLELGSRVVVPGSASKRSLLFGASSYTGFDLYPDNNTDVVGDLHKLSDYFERRFDAVFSLAVLEHVAMPWVAALQINKVLRPGGITFHQTHFAFPLHEQPADYWRFTEEGLRALFSPALGFSEVECESFDPVYLHPARRTVELVHLPSQPAFIQVAVLARKTAELDDSKIRWRCDVDPAAKPQYPAPEQP